MNTSAAARYGSALGIAALVLVLVGVSMATLGLLTSFHGFLIMVFGLGCALLGLILSLVGLVATAPSKGRGGRPLALRGLLVCFGILAVIAVPASRGGGVPRINDITTDTADPPVFVSALEADENQGRDMSYPGESFAEQQQQAYPDLATLVVGENPPEAFDRVRAALAAMPRTKITGEDREAGRIEATETSNLFRFADDVVVRIRPFEEGGSRIDVRSKSRFGKGDMGVNAGRIRTLFARLRADNPPPGD